MSDGICDPKKLAKRQKFEDELKEKLVKRNLVYEAPPSEEDDNGRNARLRRMRRALNKYEKEHEPIVDNASADMDIDNESAEIDMDI